MVKLTEEMIVARTRVSDMANVKKLNCWGAELTDISVLRKLVNVEVLSLSVNCITTLADIQNCRNLQELYIRKNKIPDLAEICWLRDLTKLKSIWLEENPCVEDHGELYRVTVIRNLPQLQKLDNLPVQPDEMADAMRRGAELIHPMERDSGPAPQPGYGGGGGGYGRPQQGAGEAPSSGQGSREESPYESGGSARRASHASEQHYPPSRRVSNQAFEPLVDTNGHGGSPARQVSYAGSIPLRSNSSQAFTYVGTAPASEDGSGSGHGGPEYHVGRRYSQQEPGVGGGLRRSPRASQASIDGVGVDSAAAAARRMSLHESSYEEAAAAASYQEQPPAPAPPPAPSQRGPPVHRNSYSYAPAETAAAPGSYHPGSNYYDYPPTRVSSGMQLDEEKGKKTPEGSETTANTVQPTATNSNVVDDDGKIDTGIVGNGKEPLDTDQERSVVAQHYEQAYDHVSQQIEFSQQHMARRKSFSPDRGFARRPKNRNSNILSAVLCLIKELDGPSLEVAEMAIRCRMEELDD